VWDSASVNQGGAYDSQTGVFTAPIDGVYWMAVFTHPFYRRSDVSVVTSDNVTVCRIDSDVLYDSRACQGAVALTKGQRVWVETRDCPCHLNDRVSGFSGFLIEEFSV
jgi:hypothetical protein